MNATTFTSGYLFLPIQLKQTDIINDNVMAGMNHLQLKVNLKIQLTGQLLIFGLYNLDR